MIWNTREYYQKFIPGDIVEIKERIDEFEFSTNVMFSYFLPGTQFMVHSCGYRGNNIAISQCIEYTLIEIVEKDTFYISAEVFDLKAILVHRYVTGLSDWACHHHCQMSRVIGCSECLYTNRQEGEQIFPSASQFFFLGDHVVAPAFSRTGVSKNLYEFYITSMGFGEHMGNVYSFTEEVVFFRNLWVAGIKEISDRKSQYLDKIRYCTACKDTNEYPEKFHFYQSKYLFPDKLRLRQRRGYTIDPGHSICDSCIFTDCQVCPYRESKYYQDWATLNNDYKP